MIPPTHADLPRVMEWFAQKDRKPACVAFTSGPDRDLAAYLEEHISFGVDDPARRDALAIVKKYWVEPPEMPEWPDGWEWTPASGGRPPHMARCEARDLSIWRARNGMWQARDGAQHPYRVIRDGSTDLASGEEMKLITIRRKGVRGGHLPRPVLSRTPLGAVLLAESYRRQYPLNSGEHSNSNP
jgi:hypothetical protein